MKRGKKSKSLPSQDREDKKDNEDEDEDDPELNEDIFPTIPPHCGAYVSPASPYKKERVPTAPVVMKPNECFKLCPKIISRKEWGATVPERTPEQMMFRVRPAVFTDTDSPICSGVWECGRVLQLLQMYSIDYMEFKDIPYSFMVDKEGNIYEGRGWGYENEKAQGFAGIGFIGFNPRGDNTDEATDAQLQAVYDLIMCGVRLGFVNNPFVYDAFEGTTPLELVRELMQGEEDVDYKSKPEDTGDY